MITTYERGKIEGRVQGRIEGRVEGLRETALRQLQAKFSQISSDVKQRVETLGEEQLRQLLVDLVKADSLRTLHLEED
jgi:predicted transposase YdaD